MIGKGIIIIIIIIISISIRGRECRSGIGGGIIVSSVSGIGVRVVVNGLV